MNIFAIIILAALLLEYILELTASLLNLKALKSDLPPILQGIYSPEDYHKSQEYIRSTTRFGLIEGSFTLALLLAFWFSGGFNWLDQLVRGWQFIPLVTGLMYIGILLLVYNFLKLPFSIYHTFVIEERFGFNRSTSKTFLFDRMKGVGLALLLGAPLLTGILALFQFASLYTWVYCWVAVVIFSLGMQYIAPVWIMPMFNKFISLDSSELKEAILKYADSVNFPVKNVLVMDGSKRSSKSNAFFTGFGRNKRIALFDTIIAKHSFPEMIAIVAHEVGHYKKKHIVQGMIISILHLGLLFFLLSLFLGNPELYQAFYMREESLYAGLVFFMLLYTPIELVLSIALQMLSRKNEYEADRFAAETTRETGIMINALKNLSATNLSNLTPHPFYVFLYYSHPPLLQRIQAIQNIEKKRVLPKVG
jgi:STE24 endopeptidase